jgi:hypothetical protein
MVIHTQSDSSKQAVVYMYTDEFKKKEVRFCDDQHDTETTMPPRANITIPHSRIKPGFGVTMYAMQTWCFLLVYHKSRLP